MIGDWNRRQRRKRRRTRGSDSCVASSPGGTITFQAFDIRRYVIATYVGSDDSGASEITPTEGAVVSNGNMVPGVFETGQGDGQGRQQ